MRLLTVAFLLLLRSDTNGRAGISVHRHHSSHPAIGAASQGALLAATYEGKRVATTDAAPPQPLASAASVRDRRMQSAPAPTRDAVSSCWYERATCQAARPPPFQA
jgi:hypothetical protein